MPTRAVQVAEMDAKYPSDAQGRRGLAAYVAHAKELLAYNSPIPPSPSPQP